MCHVRRSNSIDVTFAVFSISLVGGATGAETKYRSFLKKKSKMWFFPNCVTRLDPTKDLYHNQKHTRRLQPYGSV